MIPNPINFSSWSAWGSQLQSVLTPFMSKVETAFFRQGEIPRMATHTVTQLPSADIPGRLIYVSDETGGSTICFSDGTNWRRVQDRSIAA